MLAASLCTLAFGQGTENQIVDVSPDSAAQGTSGLTVTFTLDTDTPRPPEPGVSVTSVTIGGIAGGAVLHPSSNIVAAVFTFPSDESLGGKDAVVTFPLPDPPGGSLTFSKAGGFTVTSGADTPPSITSHPQPRTARAGSAVVFTVAASGTAPLVCRWQKDAAHLPGSDLTSHTIASAAKSDEGDYRCIVTNAFGAATSSVAVLTVDTNALPEGGSYVVVDTGQTSCYGSSSTIASPGPGEAFAGQDAQYDGNQPSYTLSGDGLTVYDHHTGLTWQRSPDTDGDGDIEAADKKTWAAVQAYPATLNATNHGGHSDWRVPSIKDLYSLIDFRGTDPMAEGTDTSGLTPFIDTNYFHFAYGDTGAGERIIDSQYASSNLYVSTTGGGDQTLFGVNFADGRIKGYGLSLQGSDKTFFVICCRGNTSYGVNVFTDNGNGTVTDRATGLMWQQADSDSGMNWEAALAYAEGLDLAGYRDWRLPNAKELQSILDYTRSPATTGSAAIDPVFTCTSISNEGNGTDYPWYWSGTTHARFDGNGSAGAYVCFGRGMGYMNSAWQDMHGAGCQRSDPKAGSLSGYTYVPYGYYMSGAPQGDAIRIFNYVRCVRAGATAPAADADGDGLSDWYEWDYNSSTTGMVATADDDEDGAPNGDEEEAGTIPTDPGSVLAITDFSMDTTAVIVSWSSELGKSYAIQCSTDLVNDAFSTTVASGIGENAPLNSYTNHSGAAFAFYRVVVE